MRRQLRSHETRERAKVGTRRSRHNKGRKPLYKEHRLIAANILEKPAYWDSGFYNTRTWWTDAEKFKLEILCEADSELDPSAAALGRTPSSIANRARDFGITLPGEWARLIAPKRGLVVRSAKESALAYPYIRVARPEHADLLAINGLIPRSIPDDMRADMCQEIAIAIMEGRTNLDTLRARSKSAAYFIRKFYKDNYEQGGAALSFSSLENEDWDADAVASSLAAKEWHQEQYAERTRYAHIVKTYTPATQFEAAWQDQIGRTRLRLDQLGEFLSRDEVEEMLESESAL